jgi:hypothetical protein
MYLESWMYRPCMCSAKCPYRMRIMRFARRFRKYWKRTEISRALNRGRIMKNFFLAAFFSFIFLSGYGQKYVFYLHGKIIENQGPHAVDSVNGFGAYRYFDILDSLKKRRFTVLSEVRPRNTDSEVYALKVKNQIDSLLKLGVAPKNITVIGASKGAGIAMFVSYFAKNPDLNFVFMAGCSDNLLSVYPKLEFYGNILSIYEKSDTFAGSCAKFKTRSAHIRNYKEIEINTGLRHGFLYRPIPEWLDPAALWANANYQ